MTTLLKRLPGNTIELSVTIPWNEIKSSYDLMFTKVVAELELPGFRRGKAPLDLAKKNVNNSKVYEEVLREILPQLYQKAIEEQNIKPILTPKIELLKSAENKDWQVKFTTAEKPIVKLKNYKKAIADLKSSKEKKIWVPGEKTEEKKESGVTVGEVLEVLNKEIEVDLSPLLLEQEVNRMLSNLVNQTQKLGMSIDDYLSAQGKTSEQLRSEYQEQARKTLALEFALEEISQIEKITVEAGEIEEFIKNAKTPVERGNLESQKYYITSLLRRQKTLSYLLKPASVKP